MPSRPVVLSGGPYDVSVQFSGFSEDLDVFLLGDCSLGQCVGADMFGADTVTAGGLGPGLSYIVADGYDHVASDYTPELSCSRAESDNEAYLPLEVREKRRPRTRHAVRSAGAGACFSFRPRSG
jgi:hypothetical protein